MHMLITWLVMSVAIWLTSRIVPGFRVEGVGGALWVAALFGLLHFFLGWLFFVLIGIGTLGLGFLLAFITRWIVSAIVLKITDALSTNLTIKSFGTALVAALVMSALSTLGQIGVQHFMGARPAAWRLSVENRSAPSTISCSPS